MAVGSKSIELRNIMDAYAIGVRAGAITPCLQDENEFRKLMGLSEAPQEVKDDWDKTDGVRKPNTIKSAPAEIGEEIQAEEEARNEE